MIDGTLNGQLRRAFGLRPAAAFPPVIVGLLLLAALASLPAPAVAVPIPWKNCGKAGDILSIQKADASVWPPPVAAPALATATFDAAGQLINLRIFLFHALAWIFDSGPLSTSTNGGFVSLPPSFPVVIASPPLPVKAGPYTVNETVTDPDSGASVTINEAGTVGKDVVAPSTTASLTFDGTPGFPLAPMAGGYGVHVSMTESNGAGVFCMDLIEVPRNGSFVEVVRARSFSGASPTGTGTITGSVTGGGQGCGFDQLKLIPVSGDPDSPPPTATPPGNFPHGLLTFSTTGCSPGSTITMTITYPSPLPAGTQYWKYGPRPGQPADWYVLPATVNGSTVTFSITDGQLGDDDLAANGTIVDQGGPVSPADVSVVKSGPASVTAGTNVSYTVTVANAGPSSAATVSLTDTLPPGTTFVSAAQTSGPSFTCATPPPGGSGTIACSIATLAAGASATFTIVLNVALGTSGPIVNTAAVSSATADPMPGNNSSTAATNTAPPPPPPIPALSPLTFALLAVALAAMAILFLRARPPAKRS